MSPPRNLTIYNHTAVSVWLSWELPLEPNGVVIQYGFRIRDLITHTVTHRVTLISHTVSYSTIITRHKLAHNPETHSVRVHTITRRVALISHLRYHSAVLLHVHTCADTKRCYPLEESLLDDLITDVTFLCLCVCTNVEFLRSFNHRVSVRLQAS